MLRIFSLAAVLALTIALPSAGQVTVTGRVVDDVGNPFSDALVRVGTTDRWLTTGPDGTFRFLAVRAGQHRMTLSHPAAEPRAFTLNLPADRSVMELGTLQLTRAEAGVRRIHGRVLAASNGAPLSTVVLRVFNQPALTTDSSGRFVIDVAPLDNNPSVPITLARLGYTRRDTTLTLGPTPEIPIDFRLSESPLTLAGIVVEEIGGPATSPRIAGFFDRRRQGFGDFFTAEDIMRIGTPAVSDIVRRVPGVQVFSQDNVSLIGGGPAGLQSQMDWADRILLSFGRGGTGICEPAIFIDDARVRPRNIDAMVASNRIAAMEVYQSPADVPVVYRGPGSECGALVIWTRQMTADEVSPFEIGIGIGGAAANGQVTRDWISAYMAIPLGANVDLYPAFASLRTEPVGGYRFRLAGRYRVSLGLPVGLHAGFGIYFLNQSNGRGLESKPGLVIGAPLQLGPVRITTEAEWISPFSRPQLDLGIHIGYALPSAN